MAEAETAEDVGIAAGEAARDEALASDWPPDRADAERIGAAAGAAGGAAACTALGAGAAAPICAEIGSIIGEYVGAAVYDFIDALGGAQATRLTREAIEYAARETNAARLLYESSKGLTALHASLDPSWGEQTSVEPKALTLQGTTYTSYTTTRGQRAEIFALMRWGAQSPKTAKTIGGSRWTQLLIAAETARAAELTASLKSGRPSEESTSSGSAVLMTAGLVGAGWLLFKVLL